MELKDHPFFSFFDATQQSFLEGQVTVQELSDQHVLFLEGEPSDSMYLLMDGNIVISKKTPSGNYVTIAREQEQDVFGEFGVLDGGPRSARASVKDRALVARIDRDAVLKALREDTGDAGARLAAHLISKVRESNEWYAKELLRNERMSVIGRMSNEIIHDFKNPFAIIRIAAEMLERIYPPDATQTNYVEMITGQIDRMVLMANDILQFTKGETAVNRQVIRMDELFERFKTLNQLYFEQKVVALVMRTEPLEVYADGDKLLRILQNLSVNAAESFGGMKGQVAISAEREDDQLLLTVKDDGPGLPENIRKNAFELFNSEGKATGTGLGMAITHSLVKAHGGEISFKSETGQGTAFFIRIPIAKPGV